MAENLANDVQTLLDGAINNVVTAITTDGATGFPAANFRIRIDDEYMLVTSIGAGTNWTVTRAQEGSTGASHADNAPVVHVYTVAGLDQHDKEQQWSCKAWVNFNGTGTVAIRDSLNVNSITDNAVGNYTINIASGALANANFCAVALSGGTAGNISMIAVDEQTARTSTLLRVAPLTTSFAGFDCAQIGIAFFGD